MNDHQATETPPAPPPRPARRPGSVPLGSILGIRVEAHFSVLLIFGLILFSLGAATFPSWHPDWSLAMVWTVAFATAVLFFVSLLAHELAHSVVARMRGIEIDRITLFLFGGVSELKAQPKTAWTEFLVAIVGPLMSVAIGIAALAVAWLLLPADFVDRLAEDPVAAMGTLGPLATMLFWLGPINLFLAAFNMVPGFPLDGGRVLRSILWGISGDMRKATRWASNAGKVVAFLLMGLGGLSILYGAFIDGLWLLFIAWFLYGAARNAYAQTVINERLKGLHIDDVMETDFREVDAGKDVESFAREEVVHHNQPAWPVTENGQVIGLVTVQQVAEVPNLQRPLVTVGEIAIPLTDVPTLRAHESGVEALRVLQESPVSVALVVDAHGRPTGMLTQYGVMRWLNLFAEDARHA